MTDPQGAACVRLGTHYHLQGEFARAADWYCLARELLGKDHPDVLFNLAAASLRAHRFEEAQEALTALDRVLGDASGVDDLRYASRYNQILAKYRLLLERDHTDGAKAEAKELCVDLLNAVPQARPDEHEALHHLEGAATSLLASLMAYEDDAADHARLMTRDDLVERLASEHYSRAEVEAFARAEHGDDAITLYNLACADAARTHDTRAIERLRAAAADEPLLQHLAQRDGRLNRLRETRRVEMDALVGVATRPRRRPRIGGLLRGAASAGALARRAWRQLIEQVWGARRKRSPVDSAATSAVAASAATDVIDGLVWLATATSRGDDPESLVPRREALQGVFAFQALPTVAPGALGWNVIEGRLRKLVSDPVWPGLAAHALEVLERRYRRRVSGLPGSHREPLASELVQLRAHIRGRPKDATDVVDHWARTLAEAIVLREELLERAPGATAELAAFDDVMPQGRR